ncbi:MAG: dolichyl-phosphate beta-D-mannosyltransferase [Candidatus Marinimicrobia bacterium]|mgnify:CR=1 FL=1|nr:dolichyl-phosphate beta-D-mannosyltransferase [Candidatus Neomarinimicrobiota bacterium]MAV93868.1 dolichyl-phosphate beta-D-mannosyltransferase [Candidatus Neomarinimicrobiota bacterium]|tara:strand:- start:47907 stop:48623 length:717 start_codon:yes stop_codon:yes gene_type:complete
MKNLVIIPTFNEIENIPLILKEIFNLNINLDVLVVDDNSPDKTYQKVEELKQKYPNLFLILNNKKSGIGKAYLKGFNFAIKNNYSKVIQIDADMSHNPYDIKKLLEKSNDYDLVIGSRYISGIRIINWPLSRLALSYFANLYAKLITGLSIYDCTGGFKCFDIKILKSIDLKKINSQGYSFQIEMNYRSYVKNFKIKEIPIIFTDRTIGKSKMSKKIIFEAIFIVPLLRIKKIFNFLK